MSDSDTSDKVRGEILGIDIDREIEVGLAFVEGGGHVLALRELDVEDGSEDEIQSAVFYFGTDEQLQEFKTRLLALIEAHLTKQPQGTC